MKKNQDIEDLKELYAEMKTDAEYHFKKHGRLYIAAAVGILSGALAGVVGTIALTNKKPTGVTANEVLIKYDIEGLANDLKKLEPMTANYAGYGAPRYY